MAMLWNCRLSIYVDPHRPGHSSALVRESSFAVGSSQCIDVLLVQVQRTSFRAQPYIGCVYQLLPPISNVLWSGMACPCAFSLKKKCPRWLQPFFNTMNFEVWSKWNTPRGSFWQNPWMMHSLGREPSLATLRIKSAGLWSRVGSFPNLQGPAAGSLERTRRECQLPSWGAGLGGNRLALGHPREAGVVDLIPRLWWEMPEQEKVRS